MVGLFSGRAIIVLDKDVCSQVELGMFKLVTEWELSPV